jgi:hypothetical protein
MEKFEARNPKFETNSKHEVPMFQTAHWKFSATSRRTKAENKSEVSIIRILDFRFVSDFVLRISDFRLSRFLQVIF